MDKIYLLYWFDTILFFFLIKLDHVWWKMWPTSLTLVSDVTSWRISCKYRIRKQVVTVFVSFSFSLSHALFLFLSFTFSFSAYLFLSLSLRLSSVIFLSDGSFWALGITTMAIAVYWPWLSRRIPAGENRDAGSCRSRFRKPFSPCFVDRVVVTLKIYTNFIYYYLFIISFSFSL